MIRIQALHLLLLFEVTLVLCAAAVLLFVRTRKFKKLYFESRQLLEETRIRAAKEEALARVEPAPPAPEQPAPAVELPQPTAAADSSEKLSNMQHIVDFQKSMILDLLSSKDTFENTRQKLTSIHKSCQELRQKIDTRIEPEVGKDEQAGILESSNQDLEANISLLKAENESLSAKFSAWEEQLRNLWNSPAAKGQAGLSRVAGEGSSQGNAELSAKIRELEQMMEEKNSGLKDLQAKLDNLEKEYLILYQQKQEQEKEQQNG